jgi:hypothetical protein
MNLLFVEAILNSLNNFVGLFHVLEHLGHFKAIQKCKKKNED